MTEHGWQRTAAAAVLGGLIAFLACFADLLRKVETFEIAWNPPTYGDLMMCIVWMLVAVAFACKLDIPLVGRVFKLDVSTLFEAAKRLSSPTTKE